MSTADRLAEIKREVLERYRDESYIEMDPKTVRWLVAEVERLRAVLGSIPLQNFAVLPAEPAEGAVAKRPAND